MFLITSTKFKKVIFNEIATNVKSKYKVTKMRPRVEENSMIIRINLYNSRENCAKNVSAKMQ